MSRLVPRLVVLGLILVAAPPAGADVVAAGQGRGLRFWTAFAKDCAVPPGETAVRPRARDPVLPRLAGHRLARRRQLRRPRDLRVREARSRAAERRALVAELLPNLRRGIGESGNDGVLLRSFSALDLSILAAAENQDPALDAAGYRALLDAAFAYLWDERDLRGLEPRVGWIHATAHTADLLKFLARDPRFTPADQRRLLDGAWSKLTAAGHAGLHARGGRAARRGARVAGASSRLRRAGVRILARQLPGAREAGVVAGAAGRAEARRGPERAQPAARSVRRALVAGARGAGGTARSGRTVRGRRAREGARHAAGHPPLTSERRHAEA